MKKFAFTLLAAAALLGSLPTRSHAAFTFTLSQADGNVTITGSGTINLTGLTSNGALGSVAGINPSNAFVGAGTPTNGTYYSGLTGPANFGAASFTRASTSTGNFVQLSGSNNYVCVPTGYVSNSALSDTITLTGATFSSLGFTPGTYTYTWGTGANADSLTVTSVVPEPSTWTAIFAGAGLLGFVTLRRRAARQA